MNTLYFEKHVYKYNKRNTFSYEKNVFNLKIIIGLMLLFRLNERIENKKSRKY